MDYLSLPSRERGLKPVLKDGDKNTFMVAPLAGAWIETPMPSLDGVLHDVAPLAGAWIETSLHSWRFYPKQNRVAPLAGAWIETRSKVS